MFRRTAFLLVAAVFLIAAVVNITWANQAPAQSNAGKAQLVEDINSRTLGSYPVSFLDVNGVLFFTADGRLWTSDGTEAGTTKVVDGPFVSYPAETAEFDGKYVNVYQDVWVSDGTSEGSLQVYDGNPFDLTLLGDHFYFLDSSGPAQYDIVKSDGTAAGTNRVVRFEADSSMRDLTAYDGALYFAGHRGSEGPGLWRSDGTETGTILVKEIPSSKSGKTVLSLAVANGLLYFVAHQDDTGYEVWVSDGTGAGTNLLKDINGGSGDSMLTNGKSGAEFVAAGDLVYFAAYDRSSGLELWRTDGTTAGTRRVVDLEAGKAGSDPRHLTEFKGEIAFVADKDVKSKVWLSDGTGIGTRRLHIAEGDEVRSDQVGRVGDKLFFVYWLDDVLPGEASRQRLYLSEGSEETTAPIEEILLTDQDAVPYVYAYGGNLVFQNGDAQHGSEPWISNGQPGNAVMIKDLNEDTDASDPENLLNLQGRLLFTADDGYSGRELWASSGPGSTETVAVFNAGPGSSVFSDLIPVGDRALFLVNDQLWTSKGTFGDARDLGAEIDSAQAILASTGSQGFILDYSGVKPDLWRSDGTKTGTTKITEMPRAVQELLLPAGEVVYLVEQNGDKIWRSNGVKAGTIIVWRSGGSDNVDLIAAGGDVLYATLDGNAGVLLASNAGHDAMTTILADSGRIEQLIPADTMLYFVLKTADRSLQLWTSDGKAENTGPLYDLPDTINLSDIAWAAANDAGAFFCYDAASSAQIWYAARTAESAAIVAQTSESCVDASINGGSDFESVFHGNQLVFLHKTADHGLELWISDGSPAGTFLLADVWPGRQDSYPRSLTLSGNMLYFSAEAPVNGIELDRELWMLDLDDVEPPTPTPTATLEPTATPTPTATPEPSATPRPDSEFFMPVIMRELSIAP